MTDMNGGIYGGVGGTAMPYPCRCCSGQNPMRFLNGVLVCDVCDLPAEMLIPRETDD